MQRDQRQQTRTITYEVASWVDQARSVVSSRAKVDAAADSAVSALRRAVVEVRRDGTVEWRTLPLTASDVDHLQDIARQSDQPSLSEEDRQALKGLTEDAAKALREVKSVVGPRRFFSGSKKRTAGETSAELLAEFHDWGLTRDVSKLLQHLDQPTPQATQIDLGDVLDGRLGFSAHVADLGHAPQVLRGATTSGLPAAIKTIDKALRDEAKFRSDALAAGNAARNYEVRLLVAEMPVDRLKEATRDRIRIGPLSDAGITTVQAVLDRGASLEQLPGVGATTASRMRGAAHTLWQMTYDEMPVRIDIKNRSTEAGELLRRLSAWDSMRKTKDAATDLALARGLSPLASALDRKTSHLVVFSVGSQVEEFHRSIELVERRARLIDGATGAKGSQDPWEDFLARPADYFAMLSELGFATEDEEKAHGDLPDDIIEAVRLLELDTEHLSASLRGYQSFGARFALVQRKVIIGDEMGLGKTVEALAVLAHLRAKGVHHSLVICPAAVVTNWVREVGSKSTLRAHRIHGSGREASARNWVRNGGIAVTTFETLAWFEDRLATVNDLGCVVIDEAHYIKNPAALRTQRATRVLDSCDRAILLTGTPLENRIDEFANLVGYLRPDLVVDGNELSARRFRQQVAPAYLRRNQEDVLTELPELVEVDEWLPLSNEDARVYRDAVAAGNFMAMRQAAMRAGKQSEKLQRLIAIVQEAKDNGRRVIVFSHFRDTLAQVAEALPGTVFGPLTGSVPAATRQVMVDQFSAAGHGAVLVSQIVAGGVGLNIQAASVVVICEPQLKPTTEWQAIARAHRMGQLETVQVHRLLSEEGVDQRITEILARKRELFDDFARVSATAESAPEAVDVSEADLARDVIAAERERLLETNAVPGLE